MTASASTTERPTTADEASHRPRRAPQAVGLVGIACAAIALHLAGQGRLRPPPVRSAAALSDWADASDPATIAIAIVRLAAELGAWYLLLIASLHIIGRTVRWTRATTLADALSTPATRRLVSGGLGLGFATSSALSGASAAPASVSMTALPPTDSLATMAAVEPDDQASGAGPGTATMRVIPPSDGTATMRVVPPSDGTATMQVVTDGSSESAPPTPTPATWSVTSGESLWSIAEEVLTESWGRTPTTDEVTSYWEHLVATNRARLAAPDDPDLIFAGQVFELPTPPTDPASR